MPRQRWLLLRTAGIVGCAGVAILLVAAGAPAAGRSTVAGLSGGDAALAAHAAESPTASSQDGDNGDGDVELHDDSDAYAQNVVQVVNQKDDRLQVKGRIQLNRIPGDTASPLNEAIAYASCTDCQTFAVALQIDLISRDATTVTPQNYAYAVNYKCNGCTTVARAMQYVVQVDDPTQEPDDVGRLVDRMNRELQDAAHRHKETAAEAEQRIDRVVAEFTTLANSLYDQRDEQTAPKAAAPAGTATTAATPGATSTATPGPTSTPSPSPTPSPTASPTPAALTPGGRSSTARSAFGTAGNRSVGILMPT